MNITTSSSVTADRLEDWNDELSRYLVPDSVILMIYLVVGVLGNSVVIYIHTVRLKTHWEDRFFIPVLAIVDLISCVVSTSFSFSINMLPVKYSNDSACKIMFFLNCTCTLMSALMLVVIAINRHRKICKPFSKQMNSFWKKIAIASITGVSLVISWPCFLFYGSKEVYEENNHITGYRCTSIRGSWSTVQPLIFKTAVMLLIVSILVSLIVFYVLIGIVLFRQMRFHKKCRSLIGASEDLQRHCKALNSDDSANFPESQDTNYASISGIHDASEEGTSNISPARLQSKSPTTESYRQQASGIEQNPNRSTASGNSPKMESVVRSNASSMTPTARMTLIFMLITMVFMACYIPKVAMLIYESRKENFWIELSPSELSGFRFLYTAFIINNIVNPIIYGALDRRFRNEVYGLCPCVKK